MVDRQELASQRYPILRAFPARGACRTYRTAREIGNGWWARKCCMLNVYIFCFDCDCDQPGFRDRTGRKRLRISTTDAYKSAANYTAAQSDWWHTASWVRKGNWTEVGYAFWILLHVFNMLLDIFFPFRSSFRGSMPNVAFHVPKAIFPLELGCVDRTPNNGNWLNYFCFGNAEDCVVLKNWKPWCMQWHFWVNLWYRA